MPKETFTNPYTGEIQEYDDRLGRPLTPWGAEILDPTPMQPPLGYKKVPTMVDHIQEMKRQIREELSRDMAAAGRETFEESEDFDTDGEEWDPTSPHENEFEPSLDQLKEAGQAELDRKAALQPKPSPSPSGASPEAPPAPPKSQEPGSASPTGA